MSMGKTRKYIIRSLSIWILLAVLFVSAVPVSATETEDASSVSAVPMSASETEDAPSVSAVPISASETDDTSSVNAGTVAAAALDIVAADAGITKGYSDGTFGIDKACTRSEAVMFL